MATPTETKPVEDTAAVKTGGFRGSLTRRRNKLVILIMVIILIIGAAIAGWIEYKQLYPTVKEAQLTDTGVTNDYRTMSISQLENALAVRTNLSLNDIKTKSMTSGLLQNYKQAYIVALALTNTNLAQYKKSLDAFAVADNFAGHKAVESFYNDYADTGLLAHDENTWTKQMANAKAAVERDTSLSATQKQTELTRLDGAIKAHQMGY